MSMVSYACWSTLLSDRTTNTYFARTTFTYQEMGHFLGAVLRHFDWNEVSIVSSSLNAFVWRELVDEIKVSVFLFGLG